METTSPASLPQAPVRPRRRWLLPVLVVFGTLVIVPLGFFSYLTYQVRNDWANAEAETALTDPLWRFNELLAEQEPIDASENSGLHIIGVAAKRKNFRIAAAANYEAIFKDLPANARMNEQQLDLLRGELQKIAKPLGEARQLKDLPRGRLPIKYSDDFIGTLIPHYQDARDLVEWLKHDAWELAERGKFDDAVDSCRAALSTGRVFKDDLFLIAHLIHVVAQVESAQALERVLARGEAQEAALRAMQELVEKEIKETSWLRAMRGERAGMHLLFENIRSGKIKSTYLRAMATGRNARNLSERINDTFPSTMLKHYPDFHRHLTRAVEIAKLPVHQQREPCMAWEKDGKESKNPIIQMLMPAFTKVYAADCRSQATLRSMAAGIACERYRLQHKEWPKSLEVLVTAKLLAAAPLDPIDGRPLRFSATRDCVVVYSIGLDQRDNAGHIDRENMAKDGVDIGFRLWDVTKRARPPRPAVAVEEK